MVYMTPVICVQHIAFEEIGRFTGAIPYIHVALHLDLHHHESLLDNDATQIKEFDKNSLVTTYCYH